MEIETGYSFQMLKTLRPLTKMDHHKFVYFEKLFFILDEDASLFIEKEECNSLLSYAALDLSPQDREQLILVNDTNHDGKLDRVEIGRAHV